MNVDTTIAMRLMDRDELLSGMRTRLDGWVIMNAHMSVAMRLMNRDELLSGVCTQMLQAGGAAQHALRRGRAPRGS